jgi:hypothetical protein
MPSGLVASGAMRWAACLLIVCCISVGCRRGPLPQFPVRGTVRINGTPLRGGTVVFAPDPRRGGRGPVSSGMLDADGRFELSNDLGPGAVRGWHRVTIAPPPDSEDLIFALERYRHPDLSGLTFEVRADTENFAEFQLILENVLWSDRPARP